MLRVQVPAEERPEQGIKSSAAGVIAIVNHLMWVWEPDMDPLEDQQILLTIVPSHLSSPLKCYYNFIIYRIMIRFLISKSLIKFYHVI